MWNILGEGDLDLTQAFGSEYADMDVLEGPLAWQERALCAQTRPGGIFPGKRWLHPRGKKRLCGMRSSPRMPRVRS